jgi:DNA-binding XRE family transcriptional regulator
MREHTRKHHIEKSSVQAGSDSYHKDKPIHWLDAFKETYGDIPQACVALRCFRNRENLTQEALSELLNIPQTNISKMENGRLPISKNIAEKLAEFFKTDYRIFL